MFNFQINISDINDKRHPNDQGNWWSFCDNNIVSSSYYKVLTSSMRCLKFGFKKTIFTYNQQ